MFCREEWMALRAAEMRCRGLGIPLAECDEYQGALGKYLLCEQGFYEGREGHAADWDEVMYEQWEYLKEFWESILGQIDIPPRPEFENRCIELRNKIFGDIETAMTFSESIERAFQESGIQLGDNETFACFVYVREMPSDVSEVISPSFLASHPGLRSPLSIIMEPGTMRQIMEAIEQGDYSEAKQS